jgi:uncharacterized membrane protein YhaH (DUF805 family)
MRKYYYSNGVDRVGPFTLGELKLVGGLTAETLVWYVGLSDWIRAGDVAELSELFAPSVVRGGVYAPTSLPSGVEQPMFADPFSFEGRIRRLEYGLSLIISTVVIVLGTLLFGNSTFGLFMKLVIIIIANCFAYAQGCKRSHDTGESGWLQLIPFYGIYLLFAEGNKGSNEYGPNPKGE